MKNQIVCKKLSLPFARISILIFGAVMSTCLVFSQPSPESQAQSSAAEITKKLSNPVASLISVPIENNSDVGIGSHNATRNVTNIQPVIPMTLTPKLNLIARIVCPVVTQRDVYGEGTHQTGLSDIVASAFFSPAVPKNGVIWGAGPAFLLPSATNDLLGTKKWGVGPTAVILKQVNGWTLGTLVNQIWSVAGDDKRAGISQMYILPFVTYNWKSGAGLEVSSEITQDWKNKSTTAYIIPVVSGVTKIGKQIISLKVGPRIHIAAPDGQKPDFGIRSSLIFVFPK